MSEQPDYRVLVDAAMNRKPKRLPFYEHIVSSKIMSQVLDTPMPEPKTGASAAEFDRFYECYCAFWRETGYDTVSCEGCVTQILPGHGAICGGEGPIQSRADYEAYPWGDLEELYWRRFEPHFDALGKNLPRGMKAIGGIGNGPFEISEDLIGYEPLCLMLYDDPQLVQEIFDRIGELLERLWIRLLEQYPDIYAIGRFGDDLGYKTSTMMPPDFIIERIIPQYRRLIARVRATGKPFLLHSCGCIFSVMDELIDAGINAKHSNEDEIAPYQHWIDQYSDRIGLFGGVDVNVLCLEAPDVVYERVLEMAARFRSTANGYALGSGNSIPDYVPVEGYLAMIRAGREIRRREAAQQPTSEPHACT